MPASRLSREFELLEAEIALTFLDSSVSPAQRAELEQRLNAIRAKLPPTGPAVTESPRAPSVDDEE